MSYPGPIIPEVFGTQDKHDDDGQVIDSFFIETDAPPDLKDATQPIPESAAEKIKPLTKILTRHFFFDSTWSQAATQLLPGDARRHGVGIRVWSPTSIATDGIRLSSDIGDLNGAGILLHNQTPPGDSLSDHTGPIYAYGISVASQVNGQYPTNAQPLFVEVWAVTE